PPTIVTSLFSVASSCTLCSPSLHDALPIYLHAARVLLRRGSVEPALEDLKAAASKSQTVVGAEARFRIGQLHYEARKLDEAMEIDRKSTRLNSSHVKISYAVFCLKKKRRYS